jgi:hypothetical protein
VLYSWFTYAKNIVSEIGFEILNQQKNVKQLKQYTHIIKDSSNDYNKNLILNKIKTLNVNNKIYLYKFLKNKMKMKWNIIYHIQMEMLDLF